MKQTANPKKGQLL